VILITVHGPRAPLLDVANDTHASGFNHSSARSDPKRCQDHRIGPGHAGPAQLPGVPPQRRAQQILFARFMIASSLSVMVKIPRGPSEKRHAAPRGVIDVDPGSRPAARPHKMCQVRRKAHKRSTVAARRDHPVLVSVEQPARCRGPVGARLCSAQGNLERFNACAAARRIARPLAAHTIVAGQEIGQLLDPVRQDP